MVSRAPSPARQCQAETVTLVDLFSGIGGFSLGLEEAGFETVAFCEISPKCRHLLREHWPDVAIHEDVTVFSAAQVPVRVRAICGGFPCQDISFAGKGAGLAGERSGLWREYARLVREFRPDYIIVENVAALLGRGLGDVLGDLAALGYDAWWDCIPASAVGAPHRRDRLWLIAYPRGQQYQGYGDALRREIAAGLSRAAAEQGVRLGDGAQADALDPNPDCFGSHRPRVHVLGDAELRDEQVGLLEQVGSGASGDVADAARQLRDGCGSSSEQDGRYEPSNGGQGLANAVQFDGQGVISSVPNPEERCRSVERPAGSRRDGFGQWSTEPNVGRVAHGVPARVDRLHGLGNAVVPQIPEILGRAILAAEASIRQTAA